MLEDFLKVCFLFFRKMFLNNFKKSVFYREKFDKVLDFLVLEN